MLYPIASPDNRPAETETNALNAPDWKWSAGRIDSVTVQLLGSVKNTEIGSSARVIIVEILVFGRLK